MLELAYLFISLSVCSNGDVGFFSDNIPKIFWRGKFFGICGDGFWNNNYGAAIFCRRLGYEGGVVKRTQGKSTSTMESLFVGTCVVNDTDLADCKGGNNVYKIGSYSTCTTDDEAKLLVITTMKSS